VNVQPNEQFLEACGIAGALDLTVQTGACPDGLGHSLHQSFAIVGQDPRADVLLDDPDVSRRHAYLQVLGGRVFCLDLQSRTQTHWENGPRRSGWLENEEPIRIGRSTIRSRITRALEPPETGEGNGEHHAARYLSPEALPQVTLEFVNRSVQSASWTMTPVLALVGKSPDCRVHLVGQSVSSFHCSLVRTPLGLWVVDLLGRGGVWVNHRLVRYARLDDGALLQVGKFLIRIHASNPSAPGEPGSTPGSGAGWQFPASPEMSPFPGIESAEGPAPVIGSSSLVPAVPPGELVALTPQEASTSELAKALLVPMAKQFSIMQQQMFDQFQQAMMMMFQMFSTVHKDQMALIRRELDQVQKLTQELHTLQAELSKRGPAVAAPAPEVRVQAEPSLPPQPVAPAVPAGNGSTRVSTPVQPPTPKPTVETPAPVAAAAAQPSPSSLPVDNQSDKAIHDWLTTRIMALQTERQSRWQKILDFLTRRPKEEAASGARPEP
jgi:pSer/pThr/pTyr-binding forkhead associated (FHA) protein